MKTFLIPLFLAIPVIIADEEPILKSTLEPPKPPSAPVYKTDPGIPYIPPTYPVYDGYVYDSFYPTHPGPRPSHPSEVREPATETNYATGLLPATQVWIRWIIQGAKMICIFFIRSEAFSFP